MKHNIRSSYYVTQDAQKIKNVAKGTAFWNIYYFQDVAWININNMWRYFDLSLT